MEKLWNGHGKKLKTKQIKEEEKKYILQSILPESQKNNILP